MHDVVGIWGCVLLDTGSFLAVLHEQSCSLYAPLLLHLRRKQSMFDKKCYRVSRTHPFAWLWYVRSIAITIFVLV
jgi:hypothetical protein